MIAGIPASDFVVLDVETTGLEPKQGHEIIEIAAQKLRGREVIDEFVSMMLPTRPIPAEVTAVHGITHEMVQKDGKHAHEVMPKLVEFIGEGIIIGHNVSFDMGFVNAHLDRLGHPVLKNQLIDTHEIAKRYLILASYRLSNVATFLKVPQSSAHRALVDVETTREVFFRLIECAKEQSGVKK